MKISELLLQPGYPRTGEFGTSTLLGRIVHQTGVRISVGIMGVKRLCERLSQ